MTHSTQAKPEAGERRTITLRVKRNQLVEELQPVLRTLLNEGSACSACALLDLNRGASVTHVGPAHALRLDDLPYAAAEIFEARGATAVQALLKREAGSEGQSTETNEQLSEVMLFGATGLLFLQRCRTLPHLVLAVHCDSSRDIGISLLLSRRCREQIDSILIAH